MDHHLPPTTNLGDQRDQGDIVTWVTRISGWAEKRLFYLTYCCHEYLAGPFQKEANYYDFCLKNITLNVLLVILHDREAKIGTLVVGITKMQNNCMNT